MLLHVSLQKAQLLVFLDTAIFEVNADYKEQTGQEGFAYRLKMDSDLDAEGRLLLVRLGVETPSREENPQYPFYFDVTFVGLFEFTESIQKELRKQYAAVNCPAIIFPYLRETLAHLTRRAAFPPLHLPITNFTKFAHKDAGKHEGASVKAETLHKRKPKEPSRGRKKATRGTASKQREN